MKYSKVISLACVSAALLIPIDRAHATPVEVDGTVSSVKTNKDGSITLTVMGVAVNVPKDTPITSPSAVLTLAQLADPAPLPGRTQPGFVGGNAFVTGDTDAASGVITATDIFVEPAKHLLLGVVTSKAGAELKVNNMPVLFSKDPRMPSVAPRNRYGMAVDTSALAHGSTVLVEGYFDGTNFRAFNLEIRGKAPVTSPHPQVAIIASKCWEKSPNGSAGDEVEVRGAVTMGHVSSGVNTQTVRIYRVDRGVDTVLGDAIATRDPSDNNFALFEFTTTTPPSTDAVLGTAPTRLKAVNISAAMAEADVTELVRDVPLTSR